MEKSLFHRFNPDRWGSTAYLPRYLGFCTRNFIPRLHRDNLGVKLPFFPIPHGLKFAGGSPSYTPHIWGYRAVPKNAKQEEFSPISCFYPQFFASYPQLGASVTHLRHPEVSYMWGVTSAEGLHPTKG